MGTIPGEVVSERFPEVLASHRKLTIVIPCFNERATILELLDRVLAVPIDKHVIVIDNCSTDGTRELLRSRCRQERIIDLAKDCVRDNLRLEGKSLLEGEGFVVVLQPRNLRKGTSVKLGIALANSSFIICQDADLEYDPNDIVCLLEHADRNCAPVVFGSRLRGRPIGIPNAFQVGRIALTVLFRLLYASDITDVATCYKLMKTDLARSLHIESTGFDLDFEVPAKLRMRGYVIKELPVRYYPRDTEHGKKIRWRDGASAAWTLLKYRFGFFSPEEPRL
jgi:glycosyltransferase involved in cell wall biosynthesis